MTDSPDWFDLYWHNGHLMLTCTNRAETLLNTSNKTHPEAPFPLLISLNAVRTATSASLKERFLQRAGIDRNSAVSNSSSAYNLYLNDTKEPVLFIDSILSGADQIESLDSRLRRELIDNEQGSSPSCRLRSCSQFRLGRFSKAETLSGSGRKVTDTIYYQLTGPFADLYCIFADDIGLAASQILNWAEYGPACVSHQSAKPRVVVVLEKDGAAEELKLIGQILMDILRNRGKRDPLDVFSSIQIVLAGKTRGSIDCLYDLALREASKVRQCKEESCLSFSTRHTLVFLHQLCQQMSRTDPFASEAFNFIKESRVHNPEPNPKLFSDHIQNLLLTTVKDDLFVGPLAEVVASSLVLDALPP